MYKRSWEDTDGFLPTIVTFQHKFLRDCLPGYRLFLSSVVVCLYATLIHLYRTSYSRIYCGTWCESDRECRYAWNGWKETFVMRLSILNIKKIYALLQGVIASGWGFSRVSTYLKPCVQHPPSPFFFPRAGKGVGWWGEGSCTQVNDGLLVIYSWGRFIICLPT